MWHLESNKGVALVSALLYLLVISMLATCAFTTGILQIKMVSHFQQEMRAFAAAEAALLVGEKSIQSDQEEGEGSVGANATYRFHKLTTFAKECGIFYQVDSMGTLKMAKVHLQTIFKFPQAGKACKKPPLHAHRIVWLQINS
jgi:Tfp pilus assembly protein PilX